MKYIYAASWLAALWLMSAWEREIIGAWGAWTSIGIALFYVMVIQFASHAGRQARRVEGGDYNAG